MYQRDVTRFYCTIMRGGSSKGIFLMENDLPQDPKTRDKVILSIFGSPDPRQINGLGGAEMLTSKLALISAPTRSDADVDFVFGQVEIEKPVIHYDGLCGNISSAVGPYAIEEGLVKATEPITKVRIHSRNTNQVFVAEVPVKDGHPIIEGNYSMAGVPGTGAEIKIDMKGTIGSRTGKFMPTGHPVDIVEVEGFGPLEMTLLDVVNPCIFVRAKDIGKRGDEVPADVNDDQNFVSLIERIRTAAVARMNISNWMPSAPIPFVVFVSDPKDYVNHLSREIVPGADVDFLARMMMLGKMHQTYAGSVTCVTGAAAVLPGSVVNEVARLTPGQAVVRMGHPGGVIPVEAAVTKAGGEYVLQRIVYGRTARRLMDGYVYVPNSIIK